jgi:hypothetical protein
MLKTFKEMANDITTICYVQHRAGEKDYIDKAEKIIVKYLEDNITEIIHNYSNILVTNLINKDKK